MRRLLAVLVTFTGAFAIAMPSAWAGSPHFISNSLSASVSGNTLTVSGKEAGLGDESQVHIVVTATAVCINPGGKHPSAANKLSVGGGGDFPVQNGKTTFSISVTANFQPECSPPMTLEFRNVVVTDTTNGISVRLR